MLLDAASMYFRAFYGVPQSITAPDGTPVNAVRGFLDMTARLISTRRPDRLIACLDADWRPEFRVKALPSYKAHRVASDGEEQVPDPLEVQVPIIEETLAALGIAAIGVPGFEADDVIGTIATAEQDSVEIVSGDRDLFQLVRDESPPYGAVRVLYIARGVAKLEIIDEAAVTARFGIPGQTYADYAVLRGDASDGLPGVPGIGDKTAAALMSRFGSLENILAAAEAGSVEGFPFGSRLKLLQAKHYITAATTVARVQRDLPIPDHNDRLPEGPRDAAQLVALADQWGLNSPLDRVLRAIRP